MKMISTRYCIWTGWSEGTLVEAVFSNTGVTLYCEDGEYDSMVKLFWDKIGPRFYKEIK